MKFVVPTWAKFRMLILTFVGIIAITNSIHYGDNLFLVAMVFLISGSLLNFIVVGVNGGRMPVYDGPPATKRHFPFKDKRKIKLHLFSDIIRIRFRNKAASFSVGDMLAFGGMGLAFLNLIR